MVIRPPTTEEIREFGERFYLDLTEDEVNDFQVLVADALKAYETVSELEPPHRKLTETRKRDPGHRVRDDPYNGWITKCEVVGSDDGPLSGMDVALKDNISVAGVEMTCGSQVLEGYVPNVDATIVSRLLDAGATIVGKANMDDIALTGAGFSSAFGPALNPHKEGYLAGGSSGGSAIVVANEEVDIAIGCDQGGSIRVPSSWTGVVGLKPSFGLVPYTGIAGLENTIDHAGPMTRDVGTTARALNVLAGRDPDDPRQPRRLPDVDYEAALTGNVEDLSVGVLREGFDMPGMEEIVNEHVRDALDGLAEAGASLEEVSIPMHHEAWHIHSVALAEGMVAAFRGEGVGHNTRGWYNTSWVENFGKARRAQGGDFPIGVKLNLLMGAYMSDQYHSKFYAKAMNLRQEFTAKYDEAFEEYDLLAMPTTPMRAQPYSEEQRTDRITFVEEAWNNLRNTVPFNPSGHPALSVPVKSADGLPVGLQFVGRQFKDETVLRAGEVVEAAIDGPN